MADDADPSEPIRFRTSKKRKAYRQRAEDDDSTITTTTNNNSISTPDPIIPIAAPRAPSIPRSFGGEDSNDEEQPANHSHTQDPDDHDGAESAAAAALRLRTSHRSARLRGMGFKSDAQQQPRPGPAPSSSSSSQALVLKDQGVDAAAHDAGGVDSRFMHQTGLLTILDDVHMNEFIEARLASRNARPPQKPPASHPSASTSSSSSSSDDDDDDRHSNNGPHRNGDDPAAEPRPAHVAIHSRAKDHQPARHGKLFEVAIPDAVRRDKDGDKTDAAKRRRLHDPTGKDARKPGRTTDDIQRDAMVEQLLHENRLRVYDTAGPSSSASASSSAAPAHRYAPGKDFSADARLAEQFRRQYYEDLALRRKKRRPALSKEQQQQRAAQATEVLKGPKLGGSRNQRAAIRNILLQQQGEKKR